MTVIKSGLNTHQPASMAESPDGVLYIANGIDTPLRWDAQTTSAEVAGIAKPASGFQLAGTTSGSIYGKYDAYIRYIDKDGQRGNLSTLSSITITSGAAVTSFAYSAIPTSSGGREVGRELWRTADGTSGRTIYLDATLDDMSTTVHTSERTDSNLILQTSMNLLTSDGYPNANRFGKPPDHMGVVVSYGDRMWYGASVEYRGGMVTTIVGTAVTMHGARLGQTMVDRKFRVAGKLPATIASVDSTTTMTLSTSQATGYGTANHHYAIYKDEDERSRIYFSESGEPESFPLDSDGNHVNVLELQEDGDPEITALMPLYSYLFIFKNRHVYRLSTAGDPRRDASVSLVAERGCLNQRCWCRVEGTAFVWDESGIYIFKGSETQAVSGPVQDYFRGTINWDQKKWFHVQHSADEETVRFFAAFDSDTYPEHALCFNYRLQQWHVEEYPFEIGCSGLATVNGQSRTVVGADHTMTLLGEGVLDGCAESATSRQDSLGDLSSGQVRGTVDSATSTTITDDDADLDFSAWHVEPTDVGAPLYIIDTNGDWQMRRISGISGQVITVQSAFSTTPSAGDTWAIGAIEFEAKFGTFSYLPLEQENVRQLQLRYEQQDNGSTLNLRRYVNHSESPETAEVDLNREDGVQVNAGSANLQCDLTDDTGHLQWRFDDGFEGRGPSERMLEVELKGVSGADKTKIYSLDIDGVE